MKTALTILVAALTFGATASVCPADSMSYGTLVGVDYTFSNIVEDSMTDPLPLFGAPSVAYNTLRFAPTNFISSMTGPDLDLTDSQLSLDITSNAGAYIYTVEVTEKGWYELTGAGTEVTFASVSAPVGLQIMKVNGVGINPIALHGNLVFAPADYWEIGPSTGTWTGSLRFDVTAALRAAGYATGYATEVALTLDDVLLTESETGTTAFVEKTATEIIVPEPATMTLILLGFAAIVRGKKSVNCRRIGLDKNEIVGSIQTAGKLK